MSFDALGARPKLAAKARIKLDRIENKSVLLGPERGLVLNDTAAAIVRGCDGVSTVREIVAAIAASTGASPSVIEADVIAFLDELAARGLVAGWERDRG